MPSGSASSRGAQLLFKRVLELLKERARKTSRCLRGHHPRGGHQDLKAMGVKELFTPGTSTRTSCDSFGTISAPPCDPSMHFELTREQEAVRAMAVTGPSPSRGHHPHERSPQIQPRPAGLGAAESMCGRPSAEVI